MINGAFYAGILQMLRTCIAVTILALTSFSRASAECLPVDGSWPVAVSVIPAVRNGEQGVILRLEPKVAASLIEHSIRWNVRGVDIRVDLGLQNHCTSGLGDDNPTQIEAFVPDVSNGDYSILFAVSTGTSTGGITVEDYFESQHNVTVQGVPASVISLPALESWSVSLMIFSFLYLGVFTRSWKHE